MVRSVPFISETFSSRAFSPSALVASAFSSLARSFIAARSAAVNPLVAPVRFVGVRFVEALFVAVFFVAITCLLACRFSASDSTEAMGRWFRITHTYLNCGSRLDTRAARSGPVATRGLGAERV